MLVTHASKGLEILTELQITNAKPTPGSTSPVDEYGKCLEPEQPLTINSQDAIREEININCEFVFSWPELGVECLTEIDLDEPDGYPMLGRWVSRSRNLLIFRRYKYLFVRNLLYLQDEVREYETQLRRMDREYERRQPELLRSREKEDRCSAEHSRLLRRMRKSLKEYGTRRCVTSTSHQREVQRCELTTQRRGADVPLP